MDVTSSLDLYASQCNDVEAMRSSLLSIDRRDPNSAGKAMQNITILDDHFVLTEERYAILEDLDGEIWRPITEWQQLNTIHQLVSSYEVSNLGRVRRTAHDTYYVRYGKEICSHHPTKMLGRHADFNGYYCVSLSSTKHNNLLIRLSRLVCFVFSGPPDDPSMEVDHINRDIHDNRAVNLEWVTREENHRRQRRFSHRGYFSEFPEIKFNSFTEASLAIGRDSSYIGVYLEGGYPIRPVNSNLILHWKESK